MIVGMRRKENSDYSNVDIKTGFGYKDSASLLTPMKILMITMDNCQDMMHASM